VENIRQDLTGYRMPAYMEEILTENYCGNFMKMSIVRDGGHYSFSYRPGNLSRLDTVNLRLYDKLLLLRNLIKLIEDNSDHLISAENYLLEPELIYAKDGSVDIGSIKLMYYPDAKKLELRYKIVLFADRIMDKTIKEERDMADRIREAAEPGDINRIKLLLDKSILRLEGRIAEMSAPPSWRS
jgi:hypothetical protein